MIRSYALQKADLLYKDLKMMFTVKLPGFRYKRNSTKKKVGNDFACRLPNRARVIRSALFGSLQKISFEKTMTV